ncbi:MAG: 5-bromo-4-chloroindolyl phosphate hydrolysis family protein [Clostridia bacterium]|nr:5-bromo-4-chloroindolyl phosphate hydrolysis family protein [Clostridia bacterium]
MAQNEVKISYRSSPFAFYGAGAAFLLYALIFPMYALWHYILAAAIAAMVYLLLARLLPKEKIEKAIKAPEIKTGDEDADSMLNYSMEILSDIRKAAGDIEDEDMKRDIGEIADITDKIIEQLKKEPNKARDARRFMEYYLPTLRKLLAGYDDMENLGISGENIDEAMSGVKELLKTMKEAARKLLDSLFASRSLDMTSDIAVMEGMMQQKGLINDKNKPTF